MNGYKKSILLIIFLSFTMSCKISKNSETEPNNTFSNANQIEINKEITGYLESENDIDNYYLNIDEEQILKIELSGIKGVNHSINIFKNENSKPQLIKVIDDNRKSSSETFANLYVQSGQYIFTITHGSRDIKKGNIETPYKLLITSRSYLNEEKEPNDNPYSATEIGDKSQTMGYFSPAQNSLNNDPISRMKEIDWYKFNINISDNTPVLIDLKLSGVTGVDSVVSVLNSAMEEIINVDSAGTGEGEIITDFGIKESGIYYIQVSSKNFLFNHDTPYELQLDYKTYNQNSELELNNSFEKANIISNNIITGKINSPGDQDFYQFIPPFKNKYYKAGCSGVEGLDIIMTVYDNNRNKLFEINNSGPGGSETIPYFMIKNSVYFSVSASSLAASESQYTLAIEKFESNEVLEIEPNNSKNTANLINNSITGFITYKNDIDYYLIKYEGRQKVKISVRGVKDGKIKISTTDQLGFIIKSKEIESDEEISFNEIFDKKGYIIVEPIVANFEFPYIITIEDL
ncbi:MAG TPA: hypothetical protein PLY36_01650 [Spirochaetota bacterium]|nr:hypothetical protein [Spirochaetota bacterium]